MRKIYAFTMALCLIALPVFAQGEPPSAEDIVSKMQSKLSLTQDQVTAITPIVEKFTSKRQELRQGTEDGTIERGSMRNQMKQLKDEEKQELSQVLSADQLSQWEKMQRQMRQHRDGKDGGGAEGALSHDGNIPPSQN